MSDRGVRTAARKEAEQRTIDPNESDPLPGDHHTMGWRLGFEWGAVWAVAHLPTRDEIAGAVEKALAEFPDGASFDDGRAYGIQEAEIAADAVLALIQSRMNA